jgi:hypothetical protein
VALPNMRAIHLILAGCPDPANGIRTAQFLVCFPVFAVSDTLDLTEVDLAADPVVEFDRTQCPHADGVPAEVEVEPSRVTDPPQ